MIKSKLSRRSILAGASALALPVGFGTPARAEEKVVRYGISMADIPLTTGQPDRGAGAYQFTGLTIYDPLVAWEMDVADRPGKLMPGLATEWAVNEGDKTLWTFKLRPGVKFHDGSPFSAEDVKATYDRLRNPPPGVVSVRQGLVADIDSVDTLSRSANSSVQLCPSHAFKSEKSSSHTNFANASPIGSNRDSEDRQRRILRSSRQSPSPW